MDTRMRSWLDGDERLSLTETRWLAERTFRQDDIPAVRRFAEAFGARAGLCSARLADFVLAASEAAACVTSWGPCITRVRLWTSGRRAFCEVRSDTMVRRRAAQGTARPDGPCGEEAALRRWVLRQLSDYVSVASGPDGSWVLLSMSVAGG